MKPSINRVSGINSNFNKRSRDELDLSPDISREDKIYIAAPISTSRQSDLELMGFQYILTSVKDLQHFLQKRISTPHFECLMMHAPVSNPDLLSNSPRPKFSENIQKEKLIYACFPQNQNEINIYPNNSILRQHSVKKVKRNIFIPFNSALALAILFSNKNIKIDTIPDLKFSLQATPQILDILNHFTEPAFIDILNSFKIYPNLFPLFLYVGRSICLNYGDYNSKLVDDLSILIFEKFLTIPSLNFLDIMIHPDSANKYSLSSVTKMSEVIDYEFKNFLFENYSFSKEDFFQTLFRIHHDTEWLLNAKVFIKNFIMPQLNRSELFPSEINEIFPFEDSVQIKCQDINFILNNKMTNKNSPVVFIFRINIKNNIILDLNLDLYPFELFYKYISVGLPYDPYMKHFENVDIPMSTCLSYESFSREGVHSYFFKNPNSTYSNSTDPDFVRELIPSLESEKELLNEFESKKISDAVVNLESRFKNELSLKLEPTSGMNSSTLSSPLSSESSASIKEKYDSEEFEV